MYHASNWEIFRERKRERDWGEESSNSSMRRKEPTRHIFQTGACYHDREKKKPNTVPDRVSYIFLEWDVETCQCYYCTSTNNCYLLHFTFSNILDEHTTHHHHYNNHHHHFTTATQKHTPDYAIIIVTMSNIRTNT